MMDWRSLFVDFPRRLGMLRKEKGLSQPQLAQAIGVHVSQLRRYEAGTSQPTLQVLKKMAVTLGVGADMLLFGDDERGPAEEFRLQFEALKDFDEDEKQAAKAVLDALILRHEARRWSKAS